MELSEMEWDSLEEATEEIEEYIAEFDSEIAELENLDAELENALDNLDERIAELEEWFAKHENDATEKDFIYIQNEELLKKCRKEREDFSFQQVKIQEQLQELYAGKEQLTDTLTELHQSAQESSDNSSGRSISGKIVKKIAKAPAKFAIDSVKNSAKMVVQKANPFDKKINQQEVTDSGIEGIRLGYTTVKQGKNAIKTADKTIKTTQRTIKTTETVAKATGKAIYKTARFTIKTTSTAIRITNTVAIQVFATITNPVVIIVVTFFLLIFMLISFTSILLFAGDTNTKTAQASALGLGNVPTQYQEGLNLYHDALEARKNEFFQIIDSTYYSYEDIPNSNLLYMERFLEDGGQTIYAKSFASEERKFSLKAGWKFTITEKEMLAIAYVYLEKKANEAHHTENNIYSISYTYEAFEDLMEEFVKFTDSTYENQMCPSNNCAKHTKTVSNPDYTNAWNKRNEAANNYNNATSDSDKEYWGGQYVYWDGVVNDTPETKEETYYICDKKHLLHSIGLQFYTKENVMDALGFTNYQKEWVSLTEQGFESNPNIP